LKRRFWGIIGLGVILLLLAGWVDWWEPGAGQKNDQALQSTLAPNKEMSLVACDSSQQIYTGPLVPDQSTPGAAKSLESIEPVDAIPSSAWSARAGFSISSSTDPGYWAKMLGSGWYLDWSMRNEIAANGPEHWQMVRVHEDCISPSPQAIQSSASRFPGQVWIIGNEPDVIWQDNVTPGSYAFYYHALYYLIKASDPIAQVAVGGISQASPLRLEYLDQVLQSYQDRYHEALPADWWTVHGYVLREEQNSWGVEIPPGMHVAQGQLYEVSDHGRLDLFEKQLVAFRTWMKENGYQDTPLALTEFGILMPTSYGFPTEFIADYLEQTFSWLYQSQDSSTGYPDDSYHLVQKWAWFSISDTNYPSSNLGDISNGRLTLIGERFRFVVSKKG
jgi:hypothetical protein